ncbi:MAG: hypothetical protein KGJ86_09590, partial [Chloroflexota bacterium]|nr:hypothetical protein [Chloroflexota bacterium]
MFIRLYQPSQLKSKRELPLSSIFGPFADALENSPHDLTQVQVTFDWVQYKHSFREPFTPRHILDDWGEYRPGHGEMAIDLRQIEPATFAEEFNRATHLLIEPRGDEGKLPLEDFQAGGASIVWTFNRFFWQHLESWEAAFKKDFTRALPGGESDGTNPEYVRDQVNRFVLQLDDLAHHHLVPEEIFVLEMGVGNGLQSKRWMDEFRKQCEESGKDYYQRLRYIMSDLSQHVLDHARPMIAEHADKTSLIPMNALDPESALGFLRYKILYVHLCNVYDNLPCTEVARIHNRYYEVEVRAYLSQPAAEAICQTYRIKPKDLRQEVERLLKIGPDYFKSVETGVRFWNDVWQAVRLDERYAPITDMSGYPLADRVSGDEVVALLESYPGDIRFHLSNGAVKSFVHTVPLLHPKGIFEVQDIFTTRLDQYRQSFRG